MDDRYLTTFWHEYLHYLFGLTPAGMSLFTYKVLELLSPAAGSVCGNLTSSLDVSWWPRLPQEGTTNDGQRRLIEVDKELKHDHETMRWWVAGTSVDSFGIRKKWGRTIGILDVIEGISEISIDFLPGYYRSSTFGKGSRRPQEIKYTLLRKLGEAYGWSAKDLFLLIWESLFTMPDDPVDYICSTLAGQKRRALESRLHSGSGHRYDPASCDIEELRLFVQAVQHMEPELEDIGRRIISYAGMIKEEFDRNFIELFHAFPPPPIFLQTRERVIVLSPTCTPKWHAMVVHRILNAIPVLVALYPELNPCPFSYDDHDHELPTGLLCTQPCPNGNWRPHDLEQAHCLLGTMLRHYEFPPADSKLS
jgi:hypothetical protein